MGKKKSGKHKHKKHAQHNENSLLQNPDTLALKETFKLDLERLMQEQPTEYINAIFAKAFGNINVDILRNIFPDNFQQYLELDEQSICSLAKRLIYAEKLEELEFIHENYPDYLQANVYQLMRSAIILDKPLSTGYLLSRRVCAPDSTFEHGHNLLHLATIAGAGGQLIQTLINEGVNYDAKDVLGKTPLHLAVMYKNLDACRMLASITADINAFDDQGNAAIHLSARHNNLVYRNILIENGANVRLANRDGETCKDFDRSKSRQLQLHKQNIQKDLENHKGQYRKVKEDLEQEIIQSNPNMLDYACYSYYELLFCRFNSKTFNNTKNHFVSFINDELTRSNKEYVELLCTQFTMFAYLFLLSGSGHTIEDFNRFYEADVVSSDEAAATLYNTLAAAFRQVGKYDEAMSTNQVALNILDHAEVEHGITARIREVKHAALYNRGLLYIDHRNVTAAATFFKQALEYDSGNVNTIMKLYEALVFNQEYEEARVLVLRQIADIPLQNLLLEIINCMSDDKDWKDFDHDLFNNVQIVDESLRNIYQKHYYPIMLEIALTEERYDDARNYCLEYSSYTINNSHMAVDLIIAGKYISICFLDGSYELALQYIEGLTKNNQVSSALVASNKPLQIMLAAIYCELGRQEDALEILRLFLDINIEDLGLGTSMEEILAYGYCCQAANDQRLAYVEKMRFAEKALELGISPLWYKYLVNSLAESYVNSDEDITVNDNSDIKNYDPYQVLEITETKDNQESQSYQAQLGFANPVEYSNVSQVDIDKNVDYSRYSLDELKTLEENGEIHPKIANKFYSRLKKIQKFALDKMADCIKSIAKNSQTIDGKDLGHTWCLDDRLFSSKDPWMHEIHSKSGNYWAMIDLTLSHQLDPRTRVRFENSLDKGGATRFYAQNGIKQESSDTIFRLKYKGDARLIADKMFINSNGDKLVIFDGYVTHGQYDPNQPLDILSVLSYETKVGGGKEEYDSWE